MKPEKPNIYTAEFRASAVKLANESDKPITQVAKDLGINVNTLHTWIGKYSRPKENDKTVRSDKHLYDELKRLKKEVARLTEERYLLIKTAAYFAKLLFKNPNRSNRRDRRGGGPVASGTSVVLA